MVNRRGFALAATSGFYGATNDKTIIRFDKAAMRIKNGAYAHIRTTIFNKLGEEVILKGMHHINDNGYHHWATSMEPSKHSTSDEEYRWSEMLESLRKDVECYFGILKQIFAILKYGCRFQDQRVMDDIFFTCVAIRNQMKASQGDNEPWAYETDQIGDTDAQKEGGVFNRMKETRDYHLPVRTCVI